jgi:CMP-N,N'-diacetyllegionaminic acid synthase
MKKPTGSLMRFLVYKGKSFLAVIPARKGSKRLPKKNILDLCGKPLVAWTIEAAMRSNYIDKVIVSTDCEEVGAVSKKQGTLTIDRPEELAIDSATTFDVVKNTMDRINESFDYIILLQPTSPLRDSKHIDESIELISIKKADAIISVSMTEHSPLWCNTLNNNEEMSNFISNDIKNKRSQDLDDYYRLNGAIYICNSTRLLYEKTFFIKDNIFAYKMERIFSVDIDEEIDFLLVGLLMDQILEKSTL